MTKLEKLIYDTIKENDINSVLDAVEDMYDKIKDEKVKADEKKKAEQKKYQEQLGKDAVDLYEHIALYLSKYYLDSTGEEKICEKKKYYEKHPMELVKLFETAWSEDKGAVELEAAKPTQKPTQQIKVYTNVDGKENSYTVNLDKWTDVLNDFFDAFNI